MKKLFLLFLFVPLIGLGQVNEIPRAFSLEKYTPHAIQQDGPYCLSVAYSNIMTILYAQLNNLDNIDIITKNRFEPYFIKYLFSDTLSTSILAYNRCTDISSFLSHNGLPFDKDFDDIPNNSDHLMDILKKSSRYTLGFCDNCDIHRNYYSLCDPNTKNAEKMRLNGKFVSDRLSRRLGGEPCVSSYTYQGEVNYFNFDNNDASWDDSLYIKHKKIKNSIISGKPLLIALHGNYNKSLSSNQYNDSSYCIINFVDEDANGHAMVIIGFDDDFHGGSYRILNSWGEDWSDNGKTWIRYVDLDAMCDKNRPPIIISYQFDNVPCQENIENPYPKEPLSNGEVQESLLNFPNLRYKENNLNLSESIQDEIYLQCISKINLEQPESDFTRPFMIIHMKSLKDSYYKSDVFNNILKKEICSCYVSKIVSINQKFGGNIESFKFSDIDSLIIGNEIEVNKYKITNPNFQYLYECFTSFCLTNRDLR